jgi:hypothetical protein
MRLEIEQISKSQSTFHECTKPNNAQVEGKLLLIGAMREELQTQFISII